MSRNMSGNLARSMPAPLDVRLMNFTASALFTVFAFLVVGLLVSRVSRHPAFAIGGIEVTGDLTHNTAVNLRANAVHRIQGSYFTVNLAQARAAFESVPWVRHAVVKRAFPNRLKVNLEEHRAMAFWGAEGDTQLVNGFGEVFEANSAGDIEPEDLPRLLGPDGQAQLVWTTYRALQPVYAGADMTLEQLELTARGGWRARFDSGAEVELGRGTQTELLERSQRFLKTITQVAAHYERNPEALETADLRYPQGYAIRLRGVTTGVLEPKKK
jgi:cell division protein FtsQ